MANKNSTGKISIIKNESHILGYLLLNWINGLLETAGIPIKLKTSVIVPLPKINKTIKASYVQ